MTGGLRERKKQATREALSAAALRLALERGPENVRVDDIAEAAGVSPRTYNNYFSSREQAIVAGLHTGQFAAVDGPLSEAVVRFYTHAGRSPEALAMITGNAALRACYADTATTLEAPLAEAIAERHPGVDPLAAQALAAAVAAAARVALRQWLRPTTTPGLVVVSGSLPDLVRTALSPLQPALDALDAPADQAS
ncbi:helix-turn-helix transcriptional regulator [Actinoplanes sp. LDG1-06]|uniref:Helix-turn-helix transcriptional regulator n=1 Tax=Paractinoplanes ovalisporus TaxID=2810368 RepID=A0ABS2A7A5_9ACTN|nr:helix-turn-helix domain-containing protein [Actinoplanes ovalisporus]MBM2615718.1 helix-turn-helix transcriptional regulator [Actinoplanes ovalisporus]